ncbi:alpha/beta fold hydrolase [Streptomyces sp. NPDC002911]
MNVRIDIADRSAYVLIPGAWHGGWSWQPVAERLRAAGHRTVTLTLPGLGHGDARAGLRLQDAVDHVVDEVEALDVDHVALVCHSWGGYPLTGALPRLRGKVSRAVYCGAFVPRRGVSLVDENPPDAAEFLRRAIEATPDGSLPQSFDFTRVMMPGAPEEAQRLMHELLTPQPGGYMLDALGTVDAPEPGIALRYLLGEDELALPRPGAEFAARLGIEPVPVPGGHAGLLTHPDQVAEAILRP